MKRLFLLLVFGIISISLFSQTITTWSGDKTTTGNNTGVLLANAKWSQPHSMCLDGNGNVWVTDDGNHCVKLIQGASVYTRVGSPYAPGTAGAYGYANAYSTSATFNMPRGIVCDASNNIYVCDYFNNAIRKIDAFTTIGNAQGVSTLCGAPETTGVAASGTTDGIGTAARFNHPSGICKDNSGNFYVTDEDNNMIRKIVIATGAVTTLCGAASGSAGGLVDGNYATAKFHWPRGITYSLSENALYVTELFNNRIRKIDLTAQTVTVWAGGTGGFQGSDGHRINAANLRAPEGITTDAFGNLLFTSGANAHTVRRIEKTTNNVFTLAGVHQTPGNTDGVYTNSRFSSPTGLLLAASTLYICDNLNGLLRSIDLKPAVDFYSDYTALATNAIATLKDTSLSLVTSRIWTISPGAVNVNYQYMNATSATSAIPQIKFLIAGTYSVKLDATNVYGTGSLSKASYIIVSNSSGVPAADFVANKLYGDVNSTFLFTNQTTNPTGCSYTWSFAPSTINYMNTTGQNSVNPQVRFSNVGFYTVTLNVTHASYTVAPITKTNYIRITGVGINNVANNFLFKVFPNPNNGNFTLLTTDKLNNASALVIDLQGKTVAKINLLNNKEEQPIVLPKLSPGIYFITISSPTATATQRLVIE